MLDELPRTGSETPEIIVRERLMLEGMQHFVKFIVLLYAKAMLRGCR